MFTADAHLAHGQLVTEETVITGNSLQFQTGTRKQASKQGRKEAHNLTLQSRVVTICNSCFNSQLTLHFVLTGSVRFSV